MASRMAFRSGVKRPRIRTTLEVMVSLEVAAQTHMIERLTPAREGLEEAHSDLRTRRSRKGAASGLSGPHEKWALPKPTT